MSNSFIVLANTYDLPPISNKSINAGELEVGDWIDNFGGYKWRVIDIDSTGVLLRLDKVDTNVKYSCDEPSRRENRFDYINDKIAGVTNIITGVENPERGRYGCNFWDDMDIRYFLNGANGDYTKDRYGEESFANNFSTEEWDCIVPTTRKHYLWWGEADKDGFKNATNYQDSTQKNINILSSDNIYIKQENWTDVRNLGLKVSGTTPFRCYLDREKESNDSIDIQTIIEKNNNSVPYSYEQKDKLFFLGLDDNYKISQSAGGTLRNSLGTSYHICTDKNDNIVKSWTDVPFCDYKSGNQILAINENGDCVSIRANFFTGFVGIAPAFYINKDVKFVKIKDNVSNPNENSSYNVFMLNSKNIITNESFKDGEVGLSYIEHINTINNYDSISVQNGSLPDGVHLTDDGDIKGLPTRIGTSTFDIICIINGKSATEKTFNITINKGSAKNHPNYSHITLQATEGTKLSDIDLSKYNGWHFKNPNETVELSKSNYDAVYSPDSNNYNSLDDIIEIIVGKKGLIDPIVSKPQGITSEYLSKLSSIQLDKKSGDTSGYFVWASPDDFVGDIGTNTHDAIFYPDDSDTYNIKVFEIDILVTKAIADKYPDYKEPTQLNASVGTKLIDIKLPFGWSWQNSNEIVSENKSSYLALYNPDDEHYITQSVELFISTKLNSAIGNKMFSNIWFWIVVGTVLLFVICISSFLIHKKIAYSDNYFYNDDIENSLYNIPEDFMIYDSPMIANFQNPAYLPVVPQNNIQHTTVESEPLISNIATASKEEIDRQTKVIDKIYKIKSINIDDEIKTNNNINIDVADSIENTTEQKSIKMKGQYVDDSIEKNKSVFNKEKDINNNINNQEKSKNEFAEDIFDKIYGQLVRERNKKNAEFSSDFINLFNYDKMNVDNLDKNDYSKVQNSNPIYNSNVQSNVQNNNAHSKSFYLEDKNMDFYNNSYKNYCEDCKYIRQFDKNSQNNNLNLFNQNGFYMQNNYNEFATDNYLQNNSDYNQLYTQNNMYDNPNTYGYYQYDNNQNNSFYQDAIYNDRHNNKRKKRKKKHKHNRYSDNFLYNDSQNYFQQYDNKLHNYSPYNNKNYNNSYGGYGYNTIGNYSNEYARDNYYNQGNGDRVDKIDYDRPLYDPYSVYGYNTIGNYSNEYARDNYYNQGNGDRVDKIDYDRPLYDPYSVYGYNTIGNYSSEYANDNYYNQDYKVANEVKNDNVYYDPYKRKKIIIVDCD